MFCRYEIEDLEAKDLDEREMMRLRGLHEDIFNIFEDTLCYLKGGLIQLTESEIKKISATLGKCRCAVFHACACAFACARMRARGHTHARILTRSLPPARTTKEKPPPERSSVG